MSNIIATMLLSVSRLVSHPLLAVVCYISNIVQSNTFTCKTYVPTLCGRIQFCSHNRQSNMFLSVHNVTSRHYMQHFHGMGLVPRDVV